MSKDQKNINVKIDSELQDQFTKHVDERGYTKYRALEGAIKVFITLSPVLQVKLMSPDVSSEDAINIVSQQLMENMTQQVLSRLTPEQRSKLLLDAQLAESRKT